MNNTTVRFKRLSPPVSPEAARPSRPRPSLPFGSPGPPRPPRRRRAPAPPGKKKRALRRFDAPQPRSRRLGDGDQVREVRARVRPGARHDVPRKRGPGRHEGLRVVGRDFAMERYPRRARSRAALGRRRARIFFPLAFLFPSRTRRFPRFPRRKRRRISSPPPTAFPASRPRTRAASWYPPGARARPAGRPPRSLWGGSTRRTLAAPATRRSRFRLLSAERADRRPSRRRAARRGSPRRRARRGPTRAGTPRACFSRASNARHFLLPPAREPRSERKRTRRPPPRWRARSNASRASRFFLESTPPRFLPAFSSPAKECASSRRRRRRARDTADAAPPR